MAETGPTGLDVPLETLRVRAIVDGHWTYTRPLRLAPVVDRNDYLMSLVTGRRIIHVGCASEAETAFQAKEGRLLFQHLERVTAAQLGVDPDEIGMRLLEQIVRPRMPLQVCYLSALDLQLVDRLQPELILIPETVEHVPDAGALLHSAGVLAARYSAEIVLTVPNAIAYHVITEWLRGRDCVHPDHVSTYTPRILQSLIEKSGLRPLEIRPYSSGPPPRPLTTRKKLGVFRRSSGSLKTRLIAVIEASMAHRFFEGWIARAAAPS